MEQVLIRLFSFSAYQIYKESGIFNTKFNHTCVKHSCSTCLKDNIGSEVIFVLPSGITKSDIFIYRSYAFYVVTKGSVF